MTVFVKAQSNFEYERAWGTYFGPLGGRGWSANLFLSPSVFFDSQNNIHMNGTVTNLPNYPLSYYQQYSLGGGQNYLPDIANSIMSKFDNNGILLSYEYNQHNNNIPTTYTKGLLHIDQSSNKYFFYRFSATASSPIPITSGTWSTSPIHVAGLYYALAKYDSNNNLVWSTYLPSLCRLVSDNDQNVYISGIAYNGQNIATAGTFLDNFQYMTSNGNPVSCGYLVKLNSSGQKIWGTYFPGNAPQIKYHDNAVYLGIVSEPSTNQISIPTAGAFQTTKSHFSLMKMSAANGTRLWGTYYANPTGINSVRSFDVNETGVYILGDHKYEANNPNPSYYGTTGSHQPQIAGNHDLFLSKFNHSGSRIWSTYIGGTGTEIAQASVQPLALSENNIYICGQIWGAGSIISTPNVYQQLPQQNTNFSTNHFFSKFNSDGVLQWTSYYGGTSVSGDEPMNIAVHNTFLYLYGDTLGTTGYTTPGSWMLENTDPYPSTNNNYQKNRAFLAKFNLKPLNTEEVPKAFKIRLFDNPNKGNFSIRGEILRKENLHLSIFDLSGRVL